MKRTKTEIGYAMEICKLWLKFYNNDPMLTYNEYLKNMIECGVDFPHYVDGLSDFIKASKENSNDRTFVLRECLLNR